MIALQLNVWAGVVLDKAVLNGYVHLLAISGGRPWDGPEKDSNVVFLSTIWFSLPSVHPEEEEESWALLLALKQHSLAFGSGIEPGPE